MPEIVIGYVFGVFDLFHVGHLSTLQSAAASCDRLIVGVGTDELVEQVTGSRPFVPESERMAIVEAVRCVSEAVPLLSLRLPAEMARHQVNVLFISDLAHDSLPDAVDLDAAADDTGVRVLRLAGHRTTVSQAVGEALSNTTGGSYFG